MRKGKGWRGVRGEGHGGGTRIPVRLRVACSCRCRFRPVARTALLRPPRYPALAPFAAFLSLWPWVGSVSAGCPSSSRPRSLGCCSEVPPNRAAHPQATPKHQENTQAAALHTSQACAAAAGAAAADRLPGERSHVRTKAPTRSWAFQAFALQPPAPRKPPPRVFP